MKVNKGRTLIQFTNELRSKVDARTDYKLLVELIFNYTDLLEQKPTKGMFIPCDEDGNELQEPKDYNFWLCNTLSDDYQIKQCKIFQEAEKKVIFKNFLIKTSKEGDLILNWDNKYEVMIRQYGVYISEGNDCFKCLKSLAELFRLTNGELELKNVEV